MVIVEKKKYIYNMHIVVIIVKLIILYWFVKLVKGQKTPSYCLIYLEDKKNNQYKIKACKLRWWNWKSSFTINFKLGYNLFFTREQ